MRWIKRLLGLVVVLAGLGLAGFWLFGPRIADQMMNVTPRRGRFTIRSSWATGMPIR
jgi:hypothetical protein